MSVEFEQIERLASQGETLPEYTTQAEQVAFLSMCYLYHEYRQKKITKEQAANEKRYIKQAYLSAIQKQNDAIENGKQENKIRIALGQITKEIELHGCELCQKLTRILDGRAEQ